jgi:hypothetical protein
MKKRLTQLDIVLENHIWASMHEKQLMQLEGRLQMLLLGF